MVADTNESGWCGETDSLGRGASPLKLVIELAGVDGAVRVSARKLVLPSDGWLLAIFVKRNPGILRKASLAAAAEHPKDNANECGNEKQKKYRHRHCRLL